MILFCILFCYLNLKYLFLVRGYITMYDFNVFFCLFLVKDFQDICKSLYLPFVPIVFTFIWLFCLLN